MAIFFYSLLLAAIAFGRDGNAAGCNGDNCYNQLARHTPSASSFCASFTTATVTNVNSFPTYLSTSCGVSRASSACSCLWPAATGTSSTSTSTVTTTTSYSLCPTPLTCSDGCYSELASQGPAGSSFCASFTTAVITTTDAFPTSLPSCGVSAASNACSCLYPLVTTPPPFTTTGAGVISITVTTTIIACPSSANLLQSPENPCVSPPWTEGGYLEIEGSTGYQDVQVAYPPGSPSGGACEVVFNSTYLNSGAFEFDQFLSDLPTPANYTLTWWAMSPTLATNFCYMFGAIGLGNQGGYTSTGTGTLSGEWSQFVYTSELFPLSGTRDGYIAIDVECSRESSQEIFYGVVYVDQVQLFASRFG